MFQLMEKKIITLLADIFCLTGPMTYLYPLLVKVKFLSFVYLYNNNVCHSVLYKFIMFKSRDVKMKTFLKLTCLTWSHYILTVQVREFYLLVQGQE